MTPGPQLLDDVTVDVSFLVQGSFYFGPENGYSRDQWETMREPLYQPNLKIRHNRVVLEDVRDQPRELLNYYRSVVNAARQHEKQIRPVAPEFWLRPDFWRGDDMLISCDWHDTVEAVESVLGALSADGDGEIYSDIDQGFELLITANRFEFTIRECDPDSKEEHCYFRCERSTLARRAAVANQQMRETIAWLTAQIGRNYWSYAR